MEDEIREEKLDSPLVVHKKEDASYQETASEVSMYATHTDEESADVPTLERHRFKKNKKPKRWSWFLLAIVAVGTAIVCALYYSGAISFSEKETTAQPRKSYTTQAKNKFEGVITVKGTYIFFEGKEVDGISGLEREIKYLDADTKFVIQQEQADSNFLNYEVLSMLSDYGIDYDIKTIVSSGLISKYEITSNASNTTEKKIKENSDKKESSKKTVSED